MRGPHNTPVLIAGLEKIQSRTTPRPDLLPPGAPVRLKPQVKLPALGSPLPLPSTPKGLSRITKLLEEGDLTPPSLPN